MNVQMVGRPQAGRRQGAFASVQLGVLKHSDTNPSHFPAQSQDRKRATQSNAARAGALSSRASVIAHNLAHQDASSALKAVDSNEREELRASAAILSAWSRRLELEAR